LNLTTKPPIYANTHNIQTEQQQIYSLDSNRSDSKKLLNNTNLHIDKNNNNGFTVNQETDATDLLEDPRLDYTTLPVLERPKFKPTKATQLV
jgi:hypothetical protein